jgi:phenylpropionate dioxygenase-like ring-hydroxylating dioxygenase large terminal subunit
MDKQTLTALIDSQPDRTALQQAFYTDNDIYQRDIEQVYLKSWLYAGHLSEIPQTGDWFLFEMAGESVIIVRNGDGQVSALLNVCRHRGSKICLDNRGCSRKLVCRYHGWSYELDGRLHSAAHMPDDFDKSEISLKKIHTGILEGMIYINFADTPASFEPVRDDLSACLRPYRLDRARVAHRQTYGIKANWKLSVENYTECYHCAPSHPEYTRGHALAKPGARSSAEMEMIMARAAECGLSEKSVNHVYLDEPGLGTGYAFERYPMWRGHVTGSEDGQPVAPLLGEIKAYDGGTTDFQVGPVTFALAYCDYVVIYRFTPVSPGESECDITWLVNGDAEEGKDYDMSRLTWLWDITTLADKRIIEHNAEGVNSRYYEPGPYSKMEEYTWKFMTWYLQTIRP